MSMVDKYAYRVVWSEQDGEFVGLCSEFPSLSWLESTPGGALKGIRKVVQEVLEDMTASGEKIPEPISTRKYTGELRLRMPPSLHRRLALEAAEQNRSLNRVIIDKLVGE